MDCVGMGYCVWLLVGVCVVIWGGVDIVGFVDICVDCVLWELMGVFVVSGVVGFCFVCFELICVW